MSSSRERWERMRARVDQEARAQKMSHAAVLELSRQYGLLEVGARKEVDQLLAEWAVSDDSSKRFDALALIGEHLIRSAVPALGALGKRLEVSSAPSAPFELAKVNRILKKLGGADRPEGTA